MATPPKQDQTPEELVAELVLLLDLDPKGGDRFIGRRRPDGTGRVFGGQAVAQALGAASRTVDEDRTVHSLHAYFLRPGSDDHPIEYRVKRDLDGRSFSNRRVVASQDGKPILNLTASFQKPVDGPGHQFADMPDVPGPESLTPDAAIRRKVADFVPEGKIKQLLLRPFPIDFRSVEERDWLQPQKREPKSHVWFRTVAPLPLEAAVHQAVLAYTSDFQILATALHPHGKGIHTGQVKGASLDHAVWFHDSFSADDWLLFVTDSPWSGAARGFSRGQVFTRDGRLVASVTQEGMLRHVDG
ncbi:acyl-CoA thioesterase [Aurantiacibacter gangjinensis]|uniref:Acyl-CoA thioesterase 2 n=1 Tax=Aurantiacibacter gangjinensis TaxID=502682 RepID=A0A0G9MRC2_9SPHN|nr:acyl-CoA thioesterase II [Aurantiacibacter gangjinensis]APE29230.1 Acyl-CoA thioesterase II [Aurantiacibacter gangjinensis]KLE33286.1 acyl-CoA thioesterase [Aurantiacibacter gangjinensis]